MRLYARIALLLGGFLLVAGLVYGLTDHEWRGFVLLLIAGIGFAYVGLYARRAVREAERAERGAAEAEAAAAQVGTEPGSPEAQASAGGGPQPAGGPAQMGGAPQPAGGGPQPAGWGPHMEEVRPTIWPLVFSLAGAGIIAGILASHWILLVGGLLAVAAAAGWFLEVLIQRQEHH